MDILRELKFDIEEFGVNSVIVKEHPAWIPGDMVEEDIRRIIEIVIHTQKKFDMKSLTKVWQL